MVGWPGPGAGTAQTGLPPLLLRWHQQPLGAGDPRLHWNVLGCPHQRQAAGEPSLHRKPLGCSQPCRAADEPGLVGLQQVSHWGAQLGLVLSLPGLQQRPRAPLCPAQSSVGARQQAAGARTAVGAAPAWPPCRCRLAAGLGRASGMQALLPRAGALCTSPAGPGVGGHCHPVPASGGWQTGPVLEQHRQPGTCLQTAGAKVMFIGGFAWMNDSGLC